MNAGLVNDAGVPNSSFTYLTGRIFYFSTLKMRAADSSEKLVAGCTASHPINTVIFILTAVITSDFTVLYLLALVTLDPSDNAISLTASSDVEIILTAGWAPARVDNCSCPLLRLVTYIEGVKVSRDKCIPVIYSRLQVTELYVVCEFCITGGTKRFFTEIYGP